MKKKIYVKLLWYILPIVLILLAAGIMIRYKQGGGSLELQAKTALNQILSCTQQQAENFDAAIIQSAAEAVTDREIGLIQSDEKLREYLVKQFGDSMTYSCIEELAMSRTFYRSIALAKSLTTDIRVSELELIKRSDQQECYNFSAKLITSAGDEAGTARGTISMEKDGTKWKASKITLTVDELHN
ncbi:MAG: hypothetical protein HDQ97_02615 [Lachnospiraceae bacterium]|nr:hypothetical protein [Lachnospiraceae bacterium]